MYSTVHEYCCSISSTLLCTSCTYVRIYSPSKHLNISYSAVCFPAVPIYLVRTRSEERSCIGLNPLFDLWANFGQILPYQHPPTHSCSNIVRFPPISPSVCPLGFTKKGTCLRLRVNITNAPMGLFHIFGFPSLLLRERAP